MAAFQIEQSQQQIRATVISSGNVVPGSLDDFRINLAPARKRYAEQERDQQACQRRLPRDGANGRKRLAGQSRVRNGTAQPSIAVCSAAVTSAIVRDTSDAVSIARSATPGCGVSMFTIPASQGFR
jgi:hypothetical protein